MCPIWRAVRPRMMWCSDVGRISGCVVSSTRLRFFWASKRTALSSVVGWCFFRLVHLPQFMRTHSACGNCVRAIANRTIEANGGDEFVESISDKPMNGRSGDSEIGRTKPKKRQKERRREEEEQTSLFPLPFNGNSLPRCGGWYRYMPIEDGNNIDSEAMKTKKKIVKTKCKRHLCFSFQSHLMFCWDRRCAFSKSKRKRVFRSVEGAPMLQNTRNDIWELAKTFEATTNI